MRIKDNSSATNIFKFAVPVILLLGILFFTQGITAVWNIIYDLLQITVFLIQCIFQMIVKIPDVRQQVIQNIIQTIIVWGIYAFTCCQVSKKKVTVIVGGIISVIFTVLSWL